MKKNLPLIILILVGVVIVSMIVFLESKKVGGGKETVNTPVDLSALNKESQQDKEKRYDTAKEIVSPAGFINTNDSPITIQEFIGKKVILVDFWTYSCINCQRTLPYLTSWYEKYKDQGLEIISIHTPEFEFEKDYNNVLKAIERWGVKYPVVLDNDFGTWHNYKNRYWPRKYLIDIDGFIVYDHIGEGAYEETEKKIQELLTERMIVLNEAGEVSSGIVSPDNIESIDFGISRSPEIYFGALRNVSLGNGKQTTAGIQNLTSVTKPLKNILYLDGSWDITEEYAENKNSKAKIIFHYQAEKVFMVARADQEVNLTILRDGQPVGLEASDDVVDGVLKVKEDKLYRIIDEPLGNSAHVLEIIVEDPGLQAFTFTFG